ncbi:hypothetical protein D0Y65_051417 [Glycine soja]|uniref:Disease resistance protein RGA3 n=1 Tax=Glycine soja TaxID=3848 RepID=A0A445FGB0_GLYSO|nr:hypothetical protein D0Y65_051417 [Glycine soja]
MVENRESSAESFSSSLAEIVLLACCEAQCSHLLFLPEWTELTSLEVLLIESCGRLESIPLHILPKLEVLYVIRCQMLNLSLYCASTIQRLRMKFLHIEHCAGQETVPQWIQGAADTMQTLLILNCDSLKMLPEWLTTMTHLKMLHIVNCPQLLNLSSDKHRLSTLEDLSIDGCMNCVRNVSHNLVSIGPSSLTSNAFLLEKQKN